MLEKIFKKENNERENINKFLEEKDEEDQKEIINENKIMMDDIKEKRRTNIKSKTFITSTNDNTNYGESTKDYETNIISFRNKTEKNINIFPLRNFHTIEEVSRKRQENLENNSEGKNKNEHLIRNLKKNNKMIFNYDSNFRKKTKNHNYVLSEKKLLSADINTMNKNKDKDKKNIFFLTDRSPFNTFSEKKNNEYKVLINRNKKLKKIIDERAKILKTNINRCNEKLVKLIDENISEYNKNKNTERNIFTIRKALTDNGIDNIEKKPINSIDEIKSLVKEARNNVLGESKNKENELKYFNKNLFYIKDETALRMVDKLFDSSLLSKDKKIDIDINEILEKKRIEKENKNINKVRTKIENNYIKMIKLKNTYLKK